MRNVLLVGGLVALALALPARAEQVPGHLASLAAELYRQGRALILDPAADPEHRAAAERAIDALRRAGIRYWARDPVKLSEAAAKLAGALGLDLEDVEDRTFLERLLVMPDKQLRDALRDRASRDGRTIDDRTLNDLVAALLGVASSGPDQLAQTYRTDLGGGESLEIRWLPQTGDIFVRLSSDGAGKAPEYASLLAGRTAMTVNPETGDLDVALSPEEMSTRTLVAAELEALRASIIGEWRTTDGAVVEISAPDTGAGEIRPTETDYDAQIAVLNAQVDKLRSAKVFVWEDKTSGAIIRQERFRRLGEPFEYKGEKLSTPDAEAQIETLLAEIAMLEGKRDRIDRPPAERFDPVGYEQTRSSEGARSIRIAVVAPDGFQYAWDEASFDGRRLTARRTYRDVRELDQPLPAEIKRQLIASWSPPTWLELEAVIDPRTASVSLSGQQWGLHVTYTGGGMMGGDPAVESIHTPYSWPMQLTRVFRTIRFTDASFRPVDEIELLVTPPDLGSVGEAWVEVRAAADDPGLDDSVIDEIPVQVRSTSDGAGQLVICIETAPASRIFRSPQPVKFSEIADKVTP